jgi:hypothetical protein
MVRENRIKWKAMSKQHNSTSQCFFLAEEERVDFLPVQACPVLFTLWLGWVPFSAYAGATLRLPPLAEPEDPKVRCLLAPKEHCLGNSQAESFIHQTWLSRNVQSRQIKALEAPRLWLIMSAQPHQYI